jgi:hypothetical protein
LTKDSKTSAIVSAEKKKRSTAIISAVKCINAQEIKEMKNNNTNSCFS